MGPSLIAAPLLLPRSSPRRLWTFIQNREFMKAFKSFFVNMVIIQRSFELLLRSYCVCCFPCCCLWASFSLRSSPPLALILFFPCYSDFLHYFNFKFPSSFSLSLLAFFTYFHFLPCPRLRCYGHQVNRCNQENDKGMLFNSPIGSENKIIGR